MCVVSTHCGRPRNTVLRDLCGFLLSASMIVPSCSDRELHEDPDAPVRWRFCTYAAGAYVIEADGRMSMLLDPRTGGHSKVCLCMMPEDYEMMTFHEQINDMALEACLEDAEAAGYADSNTCEDVYESDVWAEGFDREETDYVCEGEGEGTGRAGCGAR